MIFRHAAMIVILVGGAFLPQAHAQDTAQEDAKRFISHVSLALMALDGQKPLSAQSDIGYAQQNIARLKDIPVFRSGGQLRFAYLSYDVLLSGKKYKQSRHALLPFSNGVLEARLQAPEKNLRIRRKEVRLIDETLEIDTAKAQAALNDAKWSLAANDNAAAAAALQGLLALPPQTLPEGSPREKLQSSYDHLLLADDLMQEKHYAYSRLALKQAYRQLMAYAVSVGGSANDEQIEALAHEMEKLTAELKEEDPSAIRKAEAKVRHWLETLKGWIASHIHPQHKE